MSTLRKVMLASVAFASAAIISAQAYSQSYPSRTVRIVVPNAPASSGDIVARLVAPQLSDRLGQPVVVENRAGAGTMIGGEVVAKSAPDGYTLLMGFSTLAINPTTYKKVPYDALRDFAPITLVASLPAVIASHPSLPAKSVKELIALAKARPDAIAFASTGQGTFSHATSALFMSMAGIRMLHVPYNGTGPAVTAVLTGEVPLVSANVLSALPHIRSGRLRALGITGTQRATTAPDIPTIAEAGLPGYESVQWLGLLVPAATPPEIINRLHKEVVAVLRTPQMKDRLAKDDAAVVGSSPAEFSAYLRSETIKWSKVLKAAGVEPQ
jgi:tripartite-type tricarboxylate transporter receptor subunit TctC